MQKQLKKYFPFLFLFLFLFPVVEKQLHAFEHRDEAHCSATDKHFHEQEHNCSICDFTATDSATGAENRFSFVIAETNHAYNPFTDYVSSISTLLHLPSRAPPVA
ncbi:MAG: hypothetical protein JWO09_1489 [Bacteroidetes bacterium]|nr:hypothetical protein [Bacteroidota bacterium]